MVLSIRKSGVVTRDAQERDAGMDVVEVVAADVRAPQKLRPRRAVCHVQHACPEVRVAQRRRDRLGCASILGQRAHEILHTWTWT
jgi:hypothetical protein